MYLGVKVRLVRVIEASAQTLSRNEEIGLGGGVMSDVIQLVGNGCIELWVVVCRV